MPHKPSPPEDRDASGHRNPGISKQRESVAHWRREAERYRPTGDAIIALGARPALDYLAALGSMRWVAEHGISRAGITDGSGLSGGEPLGHKGYKKTHWQSEGVTHVARQTVGESKPPRYDQVVMRKLRAEEAWMRRREEALTKWLDEHVGESTTTETTELG